MASRSGTLPSETGSPGLGGRTAPSRAAIGRAPPAQSVPWRENHSGRGEGVLSAQLCLGRIVRRLPIVLASGLIGDPGLEIRMGGGPVIVLVILAVIPVVPPVRVAVRGLPQVGDIDPVPLLAVERLLL